MEQKKLLIVFASSRGMVGVATAQASPLADVLAPHLASGLGALMANETLVSQVVAGITGAIAAPSAVAATQLAQAWPTDRLTRVPADVLLQRLDDQRWAVLDDALPPALVRGAGGEAATMRATGRLGRDPELAASLRGDRFDFVQPSARWPQLAALQRRVLAAGRRLSARGALGAPPFALRPDPAGAQLACYQRGDRYARHRDRTDRAATQRHVTALVYLREAAATEWTSAEGGELRVWPDEADEARATGVIAPTGRPLDIEPRPGRLVLFDSRLVHEVRPWAATDGGSRCALTLWLHYEPG